MLDKQESQRLRQLAQQVRHGVIVATHAGKSGHPGGSLGAADIFTYLYFKEMHIDPTAPRKPDRDRFVLSKGHCAPGLYSTLALRGFFPQEDLATLRHIGSHLQGHPNMNTTPGVDMSTGSLGQGISAACGMALAAKATAAPYRVYALLGDGEIEEGECWEAFMFAAHYKLDNLCAIIDINGLQIDGPTKEVMNAEPIDKKMQAFGFEVIDINGNDMDALADAFEKARTVRGKPACILARTTKGKGVSFMQNKAGWHGKAPNDDEAKTALAEIDAEYDRLGGAHNG
ncbi:MAG: transketolase [Oscillospiraceae bacterium]